MPGVEHTSTCMPGYTVCPRCQVVHHLTQPHECPSPPSLPPVNFMLDVLRSSLDTLCLRITRRDEQAAHEHACEQLGNLRAHLAAITAERDSLRSQVDALQAKRPASRR